MSGPETREKIKDDAERRRNLELHSNFKDLGEPIKKLLQAVNKNITNEEMQMLSKVSVRLLTKVFNMLNAQEDPDKVLMWLQEEAARNAKKPVDTELQRLAAKDPIAFYRELDKKNQEMLNSFANAEKQRNEERQANLEERRKRREEAEKKAAKDRELALKNGDTTDVLDRMKKEDVNDITNAFNRFTDKQSTFDNTNSAQDNEWWKKDEYRRDFEKNKRKGTLWNRVVEGGTQQIPDSEIAVREEWYKSYCWWKSDKYRRDWLASLDTEWWKEEPYIREWQEKGLRGSAWLAADEDTGFNKKGHRRSAAAAELARREEWYKNNGPKGIVKMWCAMNEGNIDRCTLEEKRERHDYFKNGDWWKSNTFVHKNQDNSASCDAIRFSGSAHEDREWWKYEEIRQDFCKGGNMWKLANEKAAVKGEKSCLATSAEIARREEWFKNNWWKSDSMLEDYIANGEKGTKWRASNAGEASKGPSKKVTFCNAADLRVRENWFNSASDRHWWKDPNILRDWEQNGAAGKMWTAGWENAPMVTKEDMTENRASDAEIARRDAYFRENWWKADKYIKDFQANGGKGTAWKAHNNQGHKDKDWWKEGEIQKHWLAARANNIQPFWQSPNIIDDYWNNGAAGKMWTASNAAAAAANKGDIIRESAPELAKREAFFKENWWRATAIQRDFAANGKHGKLWKAKSPDGSGGEVPTEEQRRRREFYNNLMRGTQPFNAMLEIDAIDRLTNSKFTKWDVLEKRQEYYKNNWWKTSPEARADWEANGTESAILKASSIEVAAAGLGGTPEFQASKDEIAERIAYFKGGKNESTTGDNWWKDDVFVKEWAADREVPFWENNDMIQDYLDFGASGKKWKAISAAAAASGKGGDPAFCAKSDELADREKFFQKNFWKAPKYQADFEKNGEKGTLWTMTKVGGKGDAATQNEMNARAAWYKPKSSWKLADAPTTTEKVHSTNLAELLDREEWLKNNWWKAPHVKEDYAANGRKSKLLCADNPDVITLGLQDDPKYAASDEEIKKRIQYFETCGDNEWWKSPAVVSDFIKCGKEGAVWQSRHFKESQMSMGLEKPAPEEELEKRKGWYQSNYWKTPEVIADYQTNGSKGTLWKAGLNGAQCPSGEIPNREAWFKANYTVDPKEESKRKAWLQFQLTEEEAVMRRNWLTNKAVESKRIHVDEIDDLLSQINDGQKPTQAQRDAIIKAVKQRRWELNNGDGNCEVGDDGITQEEFVYAVASTNFYIPTTDEERLRAEQEAFDALKREEMERQDEVAGHMAMEAQEELDNAGFTEHVPVAEDDEAAFLDNMDDDGMVNRINEDDAEVDQDAWKEWMEGGGNQEEKLTDEQLAALEAEEAIRAKAQDAKAEAEAAMWENQEIGDDDGDEYEYENPADLDDDAKEELEDVIQGDHEEWNEAEYEEYGEEDEEIDEMMEEEKGQPHQWKLPLPEVTNPQYLKAYFTVIKYTPSHNFLTGNKKRIWVIDHFTRSFYNIESNGSIKKEHTANKLLQLERNLIDTTRLRLMFFDAAHSYELQFFSARERERFYESASAIRPSIRVYAPDLTNQDAEVEACTTTIDGVGKNSVSVMCPNAAGKPIARELSGECQINASRAITEPITVWTGSFNLSGGRPPKDKNELSAWMPRNEYDIYAIAVQEASYRREESEWFDYVQSYLGRDYLTLASMVLWDTLLIVLTRKKHLLKITNVEGSTHATEHKAVCGTKGGVGISLRYLETSMIFLTCQLAARVERTAMRNTNLEEIIDNLQVGTRDTDFFNQFNHAFFFGDFNYRTEAEPSVADPLVAAKKYSELLAYDQFTKMRKKEGILHGFNEAPITFAPTYRMDAKTGKYVTEKGNGSSYTDRVVSRSMANTFVKCTSYNSTPSITFSEHIPVSASFIVRCVRPVMSCFMKIQKPHLGFQFTDITIKEYKGSSINKPSIVIRSPFLATCKNYDSKMLKTTAPSWGRSEIPLLETVSQVDEYLETSHIIFIIREMSEKKQEKAHRGSGYIPMSGRITGKANKEQSFECDLIYHGKLSGKVVGKFMYSPLPSAKV